MSNSIMYGNDQNHKRQKHVKGTNERCCVCNRLSCGILIKTGNNSDSKYFICTECDQHFMNGLYKFEKISVLNDAFNLSKNEKIYLPYALNAICNRYTLQEAKRRTRLREREQSGKTTDMYELGRRMPGSFGRRQ